jgi:hypothetical protein
VSPSISRGQLQSLRLKYNAAYTACRSCAEALSRASVDGGAPSPALLQTEANALRELVEARAKLLAAMRDDP